MVFVVTTFGSVAVFPSTIINTISMMWLAQQCGFPIKPIAWSLFCWFWELSFTTTEVFPNPVSIQDCLVPYAGVKTAARCTRRRVPRKIVSTFLWIGSTATRTWTRTQTQTRQAFPCGRGFSIRKRNCMMIDTSSRQQWHRKPIYDIQRRQDIVKLPGKKRMAMHRNLWKPDLWIGNRNIVVAAGV